MDRWTNGRTNGWTDPHIEMQGRIEKPWDQARADHHKKE